MFFTRPPTIADVRLEGKTVIVTGANSGIGFETSIDLAKRGAKVVIGCRNVELGEKAVADIKERSDSENVYLIRLDLASLESVRKFSEEFLAKESNLHILINNAGIMAVPERKLSADGFELQFAVNHLGHFLLTNLLIDMLKKSAPSRVVNVSSDAHRMISTFELDDINLDKNYGSWNAYGRSKMANVLFTKELHKRYHEEGISCYSLQPGVIGTNLTRHSFFSNRFMDPIMKFISLTPEQGAQTTIFCAVQPDIEDMSGDYFNKRMKTEAAAIGRDPVLAKKLWTISESLVNKTKDEQVTQPTEEAH